MKLFGKMNKNNIAKMLGVSVGTISNDIKFLREQGMIQGKTPILLSSERQESLDKRRKKVLELYGKKSIKEIADLLGVSETLVYRDIKFLLDEGKRLKKPVEEASINSNNNKENLEEKEYIAKINRKIIDLYEKGEIEQARKLLVLLRRKNNKSERYEAERAFQYGKRTCGDMFVGGFRSRKGMHGASACGFCT